MRPIKLTMTAFGPYKDTEVVDFTELEDHDLFVISGKTGAGKTTIFDGLSFALYGSASGQDRGEIKLLRSDFADDDVHTSAELEFLLKGRHYRIRRQLGHIKKGNRSKTGDDISFFEIRGEEEVPCVDRQNVSLVNAKVEELIGLTADQFKQIVMLPQGEFRKLLTSDTENKEAILRRLFKTENYQEINEVLKKKRDEAQIDYEKKLHIRNDYISSISSSLPLREETGLEELLTADYPNVHQVAAALEEEFDYYEEKIKQDETAFTLANEKMNERQKAYHEAEHLNTRFNELDEKEKELHALKNREEEIKEKQEQLDAAERANRLHLFEQQLTDARNEETTVRKAFEQAQLKLRGARSSSEQAENVYQMEEKRRPEREKLANKITELEKFRPVVEKIEATKKEIAQIKEEGIRTKKELEAIKQKLEQTDKAYENAWKERAKLDERTDRLSNVSARLLVLEGQAKSFKRYGDLKKETAGLEKQYASVETSYRELKEAYEAKETSWLTNQAAVLAGHLHDGEACPVCGSLDHPNKQVNAGSAVSREELEQAKAEVAEKEKSYQQISIQLEAKKSSLKETLLEIESFTEGEALDTFYTLLIEKGKKARQEEKEYKEAKEKLKMIKEQEEQLLQEKKKLEPQFQELKDKHSVLQQDYQTKQAVLQAETKDIPESLTVLAALNQQINTLREEKLTLEKQYEESKRALEKAKEVLTKAETNAESLRKQIKERSSKALHAEETFRKKLAEEQFDTESAYFQAKLPAETQQALKGEVETYREQLAVLSRQTEDLRISLQGKERQDLEALQEELKLLSKQYEAALQELNQAREYRERAEMRKEQILKAEEELNQQEMLVSAIRDVHDTLRGQNSKKISFERYLQMEYLERIIHSANARLQKLSNNQYYLTRSDRQESHGKQSGLALDVYDNHTGQTRDVKTLSGGEKFHAALSLALGMSDVIQSFQGSVAIDTMFIDEGFGSLDEEALTKAVDALVELMESGRMIGVISHVKELKETFPAILEVSKRKEGHSETAFLLK